MWCGFQTNIYGLNQNYPSLFFRKDMQRIIPNDALELSGVPHGNADAVENLREHIVTQNGGDEQKWVWHFLDGKVSRILQTIRMKMFGMNAWQSRDDNAPKRSLCVSIETGLAFGFHLVNKLLELGIWHDVLALPNIIIKRQSTPAREHD
jgi:ribosomal protein L11 methylase PrmA